MPCMKRRRVTRGTVSAPGEYKKLKTQRDTSLTNCVAVSRYEDQSHDHFDPISVFPEEIWEMILNFVQCSNSVQNVFLAYPQFRTTFRNKIPAWLFDQVFPYLLPHLKREDVRKTCTHVCKTWRRAIFNFAESYPSRRPYNEIGATTIPITTKSSLSDLKLREFLSLSFCQTRYINRFLQANPNNENPFVGRWVSITPVPGIMNRDEFVVFKTSAKQLLEQFGSHIWHFSTYGWRDLESPIEFYERLRHNLSLLPNLKSLHIFTTQDSKNKILLAPRKQLPPLPHLESLTLEWLEGLPALNIYIALFRRYSNQLRYLSLPLGTWNEVSIRQCTAYPEINLDGLTEILVEGRIVLSEVNFGNLMARLPINGLQKLKLEGCFYGNPHTFFDHLYGFSIRVLDLQSSPFRLNSYCDPRCESVGKCTTWERLTIKLPNLHTVRVVHSIWESYKFLSKIPTLENLEVVSNSSLSQSLECHMSINRKRLSSIQETCRSCHYDEITKELQKWIYQELEVDQSCIWNLLPGLKRLQISFQFPITDNKENKSSTFRRYAFV